MLRIVRLVIGASALRSRRDLVLEKLGGTSSSQKPNLMDTPFALTLPREHAGVSAWAGTTAWPSTVHAYADDPTKHVTRARGRRRPTHAPLAASWM